MKTLEEITKELDKIKHERILFGYDKNCNLICSYLSEYGSGGLLKFGHDGRRYCIVSNSDYIMKNKDETIDACKNLDLKKEVKEIWEERKKRTYKINPQVYTRGFSASLSRKKDLDLSDIWKIIEKPFYKTNNIFFTPIFCAVISEETVHLSITYPDPVYLRQYIDLIGKESYYPYKLIEERNLSLAAREGYVVYFDIFEQKYDYERMMIKDYFKIEPFRVL